MRLKSTETALASLLDYLRGLGRQDGRPFLLLVFGDHQPYTFTGTETEWQQIDFDPYRTAVPKNVTFFHLFSSAPGRLKCCLQEIPSTLVPTLISAYTASGPDDVYLGINLWLYDRCGTDAMASGTLSGLFRERQASARPESRSAACRQAYASALTAFRQMRIITGSPVQ